MKRIFLLSILGLLLMTLNSTICGANPQKSASTNPGLIHKMEKFFRTNPQKRRKSASKPTAGKPAPQPAPTFLVRVRLVNGQEIAGRLIDINLKTISVDSGSSGIVTAFLHEVATMTIGDVKTAKTKVDPEFLKDADAAYRALLALSIATDGNISYSEYQPKITEAKTAVEVFIAKHERSGQIELFRTMRSAVNCFEMVVPVWSLRIGQEQHKYVNQTSKQMIPIAEMFPEIKQVAWKQNERYPIEKVIAWVWVQAARLVEQSKEQISKLR